MKSLEKGVNMVTLLYWSDNSSYSVESGLQRGKAGAKEAGKAAVGEVPVS